MTLFLYHCRTRFRRWVPRRWAARAGLLIGTWLVVSSAGAAPTEMEVKAALLFNLTQFVQWPSSAFANEAAPVVIGILGRDPFAGYLDQMAANESAGTRRVVVERFSSARAIGNCQVLFIDHSERENLGRILAAIDARPILTVAEFADLLRFGGAVYVYRSSENRVRLRINLSATRAASLTISAKLLRVVEIVNEDDN